MQPAPILDANAISDLFRLESAAAKNWLARRLALQGVEAAGRFSDGFRLPGREGQARPAAVLVPLVNRANGLHLLLTQRSADLPDHPGQISFPGGRREPEDVSFAACALRETQEETGLAPDRIEVLGELPTYETVTGYRVTPVVGWVEPPFALTPDPVEVADVFEVPLDFVLDPANHQRHFRLMAQRRRDFFAIPYRDRYIWGATAAMILIFYHALSGIDR